jgi:hypothetical protein
MNVFYTIGRWRDKNGFVETVLVPQVLLRVAASDAHRCYWRSKIFNFLPSDNFNLTVNHLRIEPLTGNSKNQNFIH